MKIQNRVRAKPSRNSSLFILHYNRILTHKIFTAALRTSQTAQITLR